MSLLTHLSRNTSRAAGTDLFIDAKVKGEANARFTADVNGKLRWGPGGGTDLDTTLERTAANKLKTPGDFEVAGTMTIAALSGVLKASAGAVSGNATTTDLTEGTNLYYTQARFDAALAAVKGVANGVATLDASTKIPTAQLPALAITDTFVVASEAAMLALVAETGDVAVRTDLNKSFILDGTDPSNLSHWQELLTPTDAVLSVNGQTGTVVLTTTDIAEGTNLYFTNARVRSTQLTGLDTGTGGNIVAGDSILTAFGRTENRLAAADTHIARTDNPHTVTKTQVGLSNVTNDAQLKIASNLSDLNNVATARTNLSVLSKQEVWALTNARAMRRGVQFETGVAGRKFYSLLTNQIVGTGDCTLETEIEIPTSNTSASQRIIGFSSSTAELVASRSLGLLLDNDVIRVSLYGATTNDFRFANVSNVVANYGGQRLRIHVTRSGSTLTIYFNGVSVSYSESTGGTPPAWSDTITSTYLLAGKDGTESQIYSGRMTVARGYNLTLSETQIRSIIANGVPFDLKWGSHVAVYSSDFSSGVNGWSHDSTVTLSGNNDAISDGSMSKNDVLKAYATSANSGHYFYKLTGSAKARRYRISFDYLLPANTNVDGFKVTQTGTDTLIDGSTRAVGTWTTFTKEFLSDSTGIVIRLTKVGNQNFAGAGISSDDILYVVNFSVTPIGCFIDLDLENADPQLSTTVQDRSDNQLNGTSTATGVTQTDRIKQLNIDAAVIGGLTASQLVQTDANKRLVSSNSLPSGTQISGFNLLRGRAITLNAAAVSGGLISGLTDPMTVTPGLASTNVLWVVRNATSKEPVASDLTVTTANSYSLEIGVTPGDGEFELLLAAF